MPGMGHPGKLFQRVFVDNQSGTGSNDGSQNRLKLKLKSKSLPNCSSNESNENSLLVQESGKVNGECLPVDNLEVNVAENEEEDSKSTVNESWFRTWPEKQSRNQVKESSVKLAQVSEVSSTSKDYTNNEFDKPQDTAPEECDSKSVPANGYCENVDLGQDSSLCCSLPNKTGPLCDENSSLKESESVGLNGIETKELRKNGRVFYNSSEMPKCEPHIGCVNSSRSANSRESACDSQNDVEKVEQPKNTCESEENQQGYPSVSLAKILENIPLAYSPVTKQLHILSTPKSDKTSSVSVCGRELSGDEKEGCEVLRRVGTDLSSFSSTSSLSTNTDYSLSVHDSEDAWSSTDFQVRGVSPESEKSSKHKVSRGISGFFSRNLFAWKLSRDAAGGGSAPGWKLFGRVTPREAPSKDPAQIAEEYQLKIGRPPSPGSTSLRRHEDVIASSTGLILEQRPPNLPAKAPEELQKHSQEYEEMVHAARKKEMKAAKLRRKQLQQQLRLEERQTQAARVWSTEILPKWETMRNGRKTRDLWWQGIPPCVRGKVWKLAIGNELNITPELYGICVSRAQDILRLQPRTDSNVNEISDAVEDVDSNPDKESSVELIQLDIARTFPHLCIFQKGGPYYDVLHSLLGAYVCYRPDVGYVQGMSFLAAVLILNLDAEDAFICFSNLLNRPCQMAFFRLDEQMMAAYYAAYADLLKENLPSLDAHFAEQGLSADLYLLDWLYTLYAKAMPLDIACRVWDVFLRDGEEFLFRTAIGILHLNQDILLNLDFIHGAKFLTKLPDDLPPDRLFKSIESVRLTVGKQKFADILSAHMERFRHEAS